MHNDYKKMKGIKEDHPSRKSGQLQISMKDFFENTKGSRYLMNLETLQEMWKKDSVIDTDLYCEESTKIPQLHMKYMEFLNTFS